MQTTDLASGKPLAQDMHPPEIVTTRRTGQPDFGRLGGELPLAVGREVAGDSLELLGRRRLRSPLLVKLGNRCDRRLEREAALAIGHYLVATTTDLNDLTDLQVELLHSSCHGAMVARREACANCPGGMGRRFKGAERSNTIWPRTSVTRPMLRSIDCPMIELRLAWLPTPAPNAASGTDGRRSVGA
jgi:hypothetical protein